jgi:hypothetical protein
MLFRLWATRVRPSRSEVGKETTVDGVKAWYLQTPYSPGLGGPPPMGEILSVWNGFGYYVAVVGTRHDRAAAKAVLEAAFSKS